MIIGISGKIGSGKDTIAKIIQWLDWLKYMEYKAEDHPFEKMTEIPYVPQGWVIKKFAGKLKQMVALLIGCSLEDLEDINFKNKELGEEWDRLQVVKTYTGDLFDWNAFIKNPEIFVLNQEPIKITNTTFRWNYILAREKMTPRMLLQILGTECLRDRIHRNAHCNALFVDYIDKVPEGTLQETKRWLKDNTVSNWLITDVRFHNEIDEIKERDGFIIRTERQNELSTGKEHKSETALDNCGYETFNVIIDNNGSISELVKHITQIYESHFKIHYA